MNSQAPASSPSPARILILDDEPDLRTLYELTLLRQGYHVEAAGTLQQAREHLEAARFDAVITDMRLPDGLGLELLRELAQQQRAERCVVITAHGSAKNAVEALKAGAFDYLTKPVDLKQFRSVVASAVQETRNINPALAKTDSRSAMAGAAPPAPGKPADAAAILQKLVGESPVMQAVKSRIVKVAGSMAPVLIRGESGTGKELVARAVHGCSHRAAHPFVAVNCGAIPENLLEAEFFGARKGAYTGSSQDRLGYFQAAKGGTLFLDEIGDLPLAMQSKLLRAIQERTVRPLGSPQEDMVDVRIVSATHKDLASGVEVGSFRQDLYYRLNVIEIMVPPLRERLEDLPALCNALLTRICQESSLDMPQLNPAMLTHLRSLPLNGNVRELENILHRAVALGEDNLTQLDTPPEQSVVVPENLQNFLDQQERSILVKVLQETGFNRTAAAIRLGLSLRQIRYRIARLGIITPGHDDTTEALDDLA
ncbi:MULTISPECIES: sigma-54 dependent transcriptional regulator [unclassified Polaromonas]|uniref:sigma-54-dependent transcriptional regulator n=1 Tax=unclassified Polaromonas TaxID=2638319 RepID=UPI0018CA7357|nr:MULTISPECIES: sigma-54 dependent transcriptional regulator [unclassified Polaromonas]MBG6070917.1 two-component system response regulator PilR (NtrC family) [Polaromonas sp. CG_9.7]MBG6112773.1 two-component system response regulator PilR (NtrC family) [Polaromonas sp. CG_9.2]